jgi:hypothetical protein
MYGTHKLLRSISLSLSEFCNLLFHAITAESSVLMHRIPALWLQLSITNLSILRIFTTGFWALPVSLATIHVFPAIYSFRFSYYWSVFLLRFPLRFPRRVVLFGFCVVFPRPKPIILAVQVDYSTKVVIWSARLRLVLQRVFQFWFSYHLILL